MVAKLSDSGGGRYAGRRLDHSNTKRVQLYSSSPVPISPVTTPKYGLSLLKRHNESSFQPRC